jgi:hypothetical protein
VVWKLVVDSAGFRAGHNTVADPFTSPAHLPAGGGVAHSALLLERDEILTGASDSRIDSNDKKPNPNMTVFEWLDQYLTAAHRVDRFVQDLWETVQSIPQYRGKTTFIITADHGRGSGPAQWKDHGEKVVGSEGNWIAVLGPDTPDLGERSQTSPLAATQIASTIAALLGEDFRAAFPSAGAPISDALGGAALTRGRLSAAATVMEKSRRLGRVFHRCTAGGGGRLPLSVKARW